MAMNMRRAFAARMQTRMFKYSVGPGHFNEYNEFVPGETTKEKIRGVWVTGNKFSQFDKGVAMQATESGERNSDYRSLSLTEKYSLSMKDKVEYKGGYYNVLQMSDENEFGFRTYLVELDKNWSP